MAAITANVEPIDATFGAVVRGMELRTLEGARWEYLRELWIEYGLLIFPGQFLTREEQDAFARWFGDLEFSAAPITNFDKNGNIFSADDDDVVKSLRGNEGWHHDSTYMPVQAKGAVFTAEVIPTEGAATGFADMRAAYEALDATTRAKIDDLCAYHSLHHSMARANLLPTAKNADGGYNQYGYQDLEPSLRPLVKVHPDTGRPNLLIGRHAYDIVGMDPEESVRFLDGLNEFACEGNRAYHHQWEVGDAILWDNRRLMHRATPFDMTQPRRMWHTRIAGERETELALNHR
jgi:alpha-ketoglutarate-dependent taurine dioxygenase